MLLDLFLHIDERLSTIISQYGAWTYGLVFLVVFCETGLVVTPFLPGDSLLFALGALAARGDLHIWFVMVLLFLAAFLGDNVNYWIGRHVGPRLFSGKTIRWLNQNHLHETQAFYQKHGGKTVIMARFVPIVRTFAPFVAGIGKFPYPVFLAYSVAGTLLWILIACGAGYFFGNIPVVQANFSIVVLGIIAISLLPAAIKFIMHRIQRKSVDTETSH
jgi:membrane-associated protein